jgi:hypothetical protein
MFYRGERVTIFRSIGTATGPTRTRPTAPALPRLRAAFVPGLVATATGMLSNQPPGPTNAALRPSMNRIRNRELPRYRVVFEGPSHVYCGNPD